MQGLPLSDLTKTREELLAELEELRAHHAACLMGQDSGETTVPTNHLQAIFDHSADAIFIIDPLRDRILDANSRACSLLGYSRAELLAMPVSAIHPKEMDQLRDFAGRVFRVGHGWSDELSCLTRAGQAVPAEISASLVDVSGQSGMLCLVRDISKRKRAEEELQEANRKMRRDLETAARIQRSLLPAELPEFPGVRFAWTFRPCEELAGDNLNVFQLDEDHVGMYVLDVSGHGVSAALLAVTLHRVLSSSSENTSIIRRPRRDGNGYEILPPAQVAEQLNREFSMHLLYRQYFTILYGVLNLKTREFRFVSGGHWGPIHVPRGGNARLLHSPGFPIGVFEDTTYDEHVVTLEPGDRLFIYSDGIPEAMNREGEQFDYKRIAQSLQICREEPIENCLGRLIMTIDDWARGVPQDDDISLLAFEVQE
jgi:PAS domain S-box-containing protein